MRFSLFVDEKDSYRTLGQIVRYQRLQKKYSLRDLGTLANISHTLISNIEKGKVVSHPDTLKDLLSSLDIVFNTDKSIIADFTQLYDEAFNFLFEYEYVKAEKVMRKIIAQESTYMNTIVTSDFLSVKYLYLALTDQIYGEYITTMEGFNRIYEYLGDQQKQIFNLAFGIYKYNYGLFAESYQYFKKAKKIGNTELNMLVDVYIVKAYVKMYRFMDAVTLSDNLIIRLEKELLYLRAMEVRLTIAYAYILVMKFDSAIELLNKTYRFAKFYNAVYILSECDLLYSAIYYKQGKYQLAEMKANQVITEGIYVAYMKMKLAFQNDNMDLALKHYEDFKNINKKKKFIKSDYLFKIILNDIGLKTIEDKELVKMYNYLIGFGKKSIDLELTDAVFSLYIRHCKSRKMYKRALELSEEARGLRKYGMNFIKNYK
jgi:transcriptional regulator with XRE-family HTH domain